MEVRIAPVQHRERSWTIGPGQSALEPRSARGPGWNVYHVRGIATSLGRKHGGSCPVGAESVRNSLRLRTSELARGRAREAGRRLDAAELRHQRRVDVISQRLAANAGAFAAAALFGSSVVAVRVAVQEVPPLSLAVLRFGQGGLLLVLLLLLVGARDLLRVKWRDLPLLILLGVVLFAVFPVSFNASLRLIEASRGALVLATIPLWSALLARIARSERLAPRQVVGVLLTLGGVGLALAERGLGWQGGLGTLAGDGLMLVTALCGAAYGVLAQRAFARYAALTVTTYAMVLGTLLLLPAALAEGLVGVLPQLDRQTVALLVFLGVFGGALGFFLWTFALTRLTPTQVAVYINLNPLVAILLAAVLLAERLTIVFATGFGVVLLGVLLVNWPKRTEVAPPDRRGK
jgi:drug/metabolite transporter (DMT)-like permease